MLFALNVAVKKFGKMAYVTLNLVLFNVIPVEIVATVLVNLEMNSYNLFIG